MARIVFGSYFIRYPLGGMMSHVLQYLVGLQRLGHEVWFVEKAGYSHSCFDPTRNSMSDDCAHGISVASSLLAKFELGDRWCFVDGKGNYHGTERADIEKAFARADVFIDMGTHGAWLEEAQASGLRVLIDGEPGFNQIKMETGQLDPDAGYDLYFTNGRNVGTQASTSPTAGRHWHHLFHPVVSALFRSAPPALAGSPVTTVMNWQSHEPVEYQDRSLGQKDLEFRKFVDLPSRVDAPLEIAVSGNEVPRHQLAQAGWSLRDGQQTTISYESFVDYVLASRAEFSVAKNVFVALNTGWFSDRSAIYLAAGRPVVMQATGFADHLPTGKGLFSVEDARQAAEALEAICADPSLHSEAAREIAAQHLDAGAVLTEMLKTCGIEPRGQERVSETA